MTHSLDTKNTLSVLTAILAGALLLTPTVGAFAAQPYIAGYTEKSPAAQNAEAVFGDISYSGTTLSGIASTSSVFGILSVAGVSSTSATDPSSYMYQIFPSLKSTGEIRGNAEVWKATQGTSCSNTQKADPSPIVIATSAEYSSVTKITTAIGFQDVAKTTFRYHFDVYKTSGSVQSYDMTIAKSSYDSNTDPTTLFMVGDKLISSTNNIRAHYTQFGVEQASTTNTGWKVKENNLQYTTSPTTTVALSTLPAKSLTFGSPTGDQYNSYATYHKSGTTYCMMGIGQTDDTSAGADYNLKAGVTVPKGEIRWFHTTDSTKKLAKGTQLWS